MKRARLIAAVVVVIIVVIVAIVAAGFMGGGSGPAPSGNNVSIVSQGLYGTFAFSPSSLTVHVGENVTWTNNA